MKLFLSGFCFAIGCGSVYPWIRTLELLGVGRKNGSRRSSAERMDAQSHDTWISVSCQGQNFSSFPTLTTKSKTKADYFSGASILCPCGQCKLSQRQVSISALRSSAVVVALHIANSGSGVLQFSTSHFSHFINAVSPTGRTNITWSRGL